mmetsp:Transcript_61822/g.146356  ORF Transcript_61822/g.146356 Transcript_61822/m.146356 type:complete len:674 (-) Transcript_61822:9-2030(-)
MRISGTPPAPQRQCIGHDTHAAEGHRRSSDDGAQHAQRRERDAEHVVAEGPEQALLDLGVGAARDVQRVRHQPRVATHERDAGGLGRHVSAAGHRVRHRSRGECGAVVQAIADERDDGTGVAQFLHHGRLVTGKNFGTNLVDAEFLRDGFCRAPVVPGQHDRLDAQLMEPRHRGRGGGLDGVTERQQTQQAPLVAIRPDQPRDCPALPLEPLSVGQQIALVQVELAQHPRAAEGQSLASYSAFDTATGKRLRIVDIGDRQSLLAHLVHHRQRQRMAARLLERGGKSQHLVTIRTVGRRHRSERRLAFGERTGLVEGDDRDGMCDLQCFGVLDEDAVSCGDPGAGHDGRGRRQAQSAGAGDDQHGHRVDERVFPVPRDHRPTEEGRQRDAEDDRNEHRTHAVHDALDGRFRRLGRLDHPDDASQRRFRADGRRANGQRAFGVDGAAGDLVADGLGHRQALAGDERFVDMAPPFDDFTVDGDAVTWPDDDEVTHDDLLHRYVDFRTVPADPGGGRSQRVQRADGVGGLPLGPVLEPLAQQDQRDDGRRGLEIQVRHAVPGVLEEQVHGQSVGRGGAQRHQQVHVAGLGEHGSPARPVEAPAQPELDGRGQHQLCPSAQHPLDAKERQQHRRDKRQGQRSADRHGPPDRQPSGWPGPVLLNVLRRVARFLDGRLQR